MTTPSYLTDLPNASDFGESFNYAIWTPETQVELCNVPWTSDYRDIVDFSSQAALDTYLDSVAGPKFQITKMTLARAGDPVRINLPFNACYQFNYLRVKNGTNPISGKYVDPNGVVRTVNDVPKTLYYFIQDVQYLAPNTTQLSVMLDVWQTFGREIEFGNCYIERGHIGVANENQFNNEGRDYLTVPESLDVGPEYLVNRTHSFVIPDGPDVYTDPRPETAWVVIGIAANVETDPGDTASPNLSTAGSLGFADGLPNGFNVLYFKSIHDYVWFILNFQDQPWITQTIMFITVIPPIANFDAADGGGSPLSAAAVWDTNAKATRNDKAYTLETNGAPPATRKLVDNWRDDALNFIPERYRSLKKFLTAPYCWIELTTYNGTPLMLRPELMPGDDIYVKIYQHSAPPTPRWAIVPLHYNATGTEGSDDDGEFLDFATFITNFPQFTVLNNNYLSYLAANKNSIAYAYNSADWSQQKALQSAQTGFDNVQSGNVNRQNLTDIQRQANTQSMQVNSVNQGAGSLIGAIGDLGRLNPAGAASDIASGTVGIMANNAQNNIRNNALSQSTAQQNQYASEVGSRNYDFATFAAKGDYQNAINAVQARVQDAKMIQPSSVGQIGGESFIASLSGIIFGFTVGWRIWTKIKQIDHSYMALIGEYWLRYGYAINRFASMPSSLKCMSKFTYWKLKETYITSSSCPEVYKQTIRGIFEKGVTVWVTPTDIGNIDLATNEPLSGITL